MTVYIDSLRTCHSIAGHTVLCHMATDADLSELHAMAHRIGVHRGWFQDKPGLPRYYLTPFRREKAIRQGALAVGSIELMRRCSPIFKRVVVEGMT